MISISFSCTISISSMRTPYRKRLPCWVSSAKVIPALISRIWSLDHPVERPDARDHRRVVLRQAEAVAPQIRRRLVFFLVAPRLLRGRPFLRDLARGGAGLHRVDRIVEPFERGGVSVLLLLRRLLADAIGAVIAGFVAVPGERGQIHEHDVTGLDDAVGEIAPVRPGIGTGGDDH